MEHFYLDPTEHDRKFLTKFTISKDKDVLYGFPPVMTTRSELIKTAYDKINPSQEYSLAENVPLGSKRALETVWLFMNNAADLANTKLSKHDYIRMWPWLNYFNVNCENKDVCEQLHKYIYGLVAGDYEKDFAELFKPENSDILIDMLPKIEIIIPDIKNELKDLDEKRSRTFQLSEEDQYLSRFDALELEYLRLTGNGIPLVLFSSYKYTPDFPTHEQFAFDKRKKLEDEIKSTPSLEFDHLTYYQIMDDTGEFPGYHYSVHKPEGSVKYITHENAPILVFEDRNRQRWAYSYPPILYKEAPEEGGKERYISFAIDETTDHLPGGLAGLLARHPAQNQGLMELLG